MLKDSEIIISIEELIKKRDFNNPLAFSPKYSEQSKEAYWKVANGSINSIQYFGRCTTTFGYYKDQNNDIYMFEIFRGQISISSL